jgi:hypothetical protein
MKNWMTGGCIVVKNRQMLSGSLSIGDDVK